MASAGWALVEDDGPIKADAILVLGGDAFGTRILRAAELAKSGYAPMILVSGPVNLLGHDSDDTIIYAGRRGYPAAMFEPIPLPAQASSTRTEAQYLGQQLKARGIKSIDLVTSNYHTRRAAWIWKRENPAIFVHVIPATDLYFSPDSWFRNREGQKTFLQEWTKTLSARLGN